MDRLIYFAIMYLKRPCSELLPRKQSDQADPVLPFFMFLSIKGQSSLLPFSVNAQYEVDFHSFDCSVRSFESCFLCIHLLPVKCSTKLGKSSVQSVPTITKTTTKASKTYTVKSTVTPISTVTPQEKTITMITTTTFSSTITAPANSQTTTTTETGEWEFEGEIFNACLII